MSLVKDKNHGILKKSVNILKKVSLYQSSLLFMKHQDRLESVLVVFQNAVKDKETQQVSSSGLSPTNFYMKSDLTILNKLEQIIGEHLSDYIPNVEGLDFTLPLISPKNVSQSFPDADNQSQPTMFNIVATYGENEELTVGSDMSTLNVSVFITSRRDKSSNLQKKIYGYLSAFEMLIWHNQSLDSLVDFINVVSADYYPAIEGDVNVAGIEISLAIQYAKEYV